MKADYIANDQEFRELASSLLDSCADSRGGCESCLLLAECRRGFDGLAHKLKDTQLSHEDRIRFEQRFRKLHKQSRF